MDRMGGGQVSHHGGILQMYYLRDPTKDDQQNMLLHRPYCGNPFVAPGTIGSKAQRRSSMAGGPGDVDAAELGLADEAAFFNENEETMLPGVGPANTTAIDANGQKQSKMGPLMSQAGRRM